MLFSCCRFVVPGIIVFFCLCLQFIYDFDFIIQKWDDVEEYEEEEDENKKTLNE